MKRKIYYSIAFLLMVLALYKVYYITKNQIEDKKHREWVATLDHTASKNVHILPDTILVDYLDEKRTLAIYLPDNYGEDSIEYPVIYFLDGQSLFDQKIQEGTEWQLDEHLDSLSRIGKQKAIVVGVYNSERRMKEYKPFRSTKIYSDKIVSGDKHAEWIAYDIKKWIDQRYRTLSEQKFTTIAGASLGGLMSYYMLNAYYNIYGSAIVFSPSFWVNPMAYSLHEENPKIHQQKIYFNAGELETPTVESIKKMKKILIHYGVNQDYIKLDVEKELGHWHMTWQKGFVNAVPWIWIENQNE